MFIINFGNLELAFDLRQYEPLALVCGTANSDWSIKLPPVLYPEIQEVSVAMSNGSGSNIFSLKDDDEYLKLNTDKLSEVQDCSSCPKRNTLDLKFKLESDLLGSAT